MWKSGGNYRGKMRDDRMVQREEGEGEGEGKVEMSRGSGEERV